MIFQLIQRNMSILGICRNRPIYTFYGKLSIGYLLMSSALIFHLEFIFRNGLTIEEYAQSLYFLTVAVVSFLFLVILVLTNHKFFHHIDLLESIIQQFSESESKFYFFCKFETKFTLKYFIFLESCATRLPSHTTKN